MPSKSRLESALNLNVIELFTAFQKQESVVNGVPLFTLEPTRMPTYFSSFPPEPTICLSLRPVPT